MIPIINGSSVLQRFERSNAVEICNGMMFDFYPGLLHVYQCIASSRKLYSYGILLLLIK